MTESAFDDATEPGESVWADVPLDVDEDAVAERADSASVDEELRLLARSNRLALVREKATRHADAHQGLDVVDVPLRCVAHAHPSCRFRWARVTIDLSGTAGAKVSDLVPREEISDHPVKITTTYQGGLSFSTAHLPVKSDAGGTHTTERDVYYPTVTSSGIGLTHAIWDFTARDGSPLHLDRQLRLLLTLPAAATAIGAELSMRATVAVNGLIGIIPLIGKHKAAIHLDDVIEA
ncbi:hypothetical protein ABH935_002629 [Catenulispora sp. GAS73]|uniref:hypothetical protein n=1 Tax=Catenulispora sp. GAS73 TaxID=3156269 RepID=UPI003517D787